MTIAMSPPTSPLVAPRVAWPTGNADSTEQHRETPLADAATATRPARAIPGQARLGIAAVAVAAAVLSFSSLRQLAMATGTSDRIAWLLPVALDAAAGVAMFVWMRSDATHVVNYARGLTWASIVLSIICNGAFHGFLAISTIPPWQVAVAVGAIPPIMFGAVAHLVFLTAQPERWGGPEAVDTPLEDAALSVAPSSPAAPATERTRRPVVPSVTTPLRRTQRVARDDEPPSEKQDSSSDESARRRCQHDGCGKLLPPGSRVDRKYCDTYCRQSAARAASRDKAVTA